jgi:hypothetical protein
VIVEVALHDRFEPLPGFRDWFVHALSELLLDICQLAPQALADRVTLHREVPVPVLPAYMRESQKIERFGLSFSSLCPVLFGKSPELNPARFVWMQFQPEPAQPFPKLVQKAVCVGSILKPQYVIIRISDDHDLAVRALLTPSVHP